MSRAQPDKIEITEEMIAAGAAVLMADPFLNFSPTGAEITAEKVLLEAMSALHREIRRKTQPKSSRSCGQSLPLGAANRSRPTEAVKGIPEIHWNVGFISR